MRKVHKLVRRKDLARFGGPERCVCKSCSDNECRAPRLGDMAFPFCGTSTWWWKAWLTERWTEVTCLHCLKKRGKGPKGEFYRF